NWKFPADNTFDFYHPQITHISAQAVGMVPSSPDTLDSGGAMTPEGKNLGVQRLRTDTDTIVLLAEYGHPIPGPSRSAVMSALPPEYMSIFQWHDRPETAAALGPVGLQIGGHPHVFPNSWITFDGQLSLRVPRSVDTTEIWWFSFRNREDDPEAQKAHL